MLRMPSERSAEGDQQQSARAARERLLRLFRAAVDAAQPASLIGAHLPKPPRGRCLVLGAGKAAAAMARAVEAHWPGPLSGLVVTAYGHGAACERIEVVEAAHPEPDLAGFAAASRMLDLAAGLGSDDLVLGLFSGGGSALLPMPAGLSLQQLRALNRRLLACGATIAEINCVRRHFSAINGGRLGAACHPAEVRALLVSDVPGDRPADIASGPTVADPTSSADALAILERRHIGEDDALRSWLQSGRSESIKPGDPRLERSSAHLVATPQMALEAAAACARAQGLEAHILGDAIEGEAREVARVHGAIARQVAARGQPFAAPCVLLSGGETTVSVRGAGRGGRNVEFLLALAQSLDAHPRIHALAADTDGIDGQEPVAGAVIAPDTLARGRALGLIAEDLLADNDAHRFFRALGDSIETGPTRTNVNDFRAILIL
ncbi:MAG TPA: glycerate kinase [Steroidobacteraceae bacterium]|nr:glycerate kinase [Steroidobacteraceae bacterium]